MKAICKNLLLGLLIFLLLQQAVDAEVFRKKFTSPPAYLIVEVLDDDLVHFELSAVGSGPAVHTPLYTSPMVFKTDYSGPSFISELGSWDPDRAIKLDPNIYYDYIWNPPEGHNGPGPSAPVWTGIVSGIPPGTGLEWKCIRKREDGTGQVIWEPGNNNVLTTTSSGYAGRSYGAF